MMIIVWRKSEEYCEYLRTSELISLNTALMIFATWNLVLSWSRRTWSLIDLDFSVVPAASCERLVHTMQLGRHLVALFNCQDTYNSTKQRSWSFSNQTCLILFCLPKPLTSICTWSWSRDTLFFFLITIL